LVSGGDRRRRSRAAALALALALGTLVGCAPHAAEPPPAATGDPTAIPRPADGNCTYVPPDAASAYLGTEVAPRTAVAANSDVDRCDYSGGADAELDYTVAYYGDVEGAAQAFATRDPQGDPVDLGDDAALDLDGTAATLVYRWGPFLVSIAVTGSVDAPDAVARAIAEDVLGHLG
jgi:hypothetical protein